MGQVPQLPAGVELPSLEEARQNYTASLVTSLGDISTDWAKENLQPPLAAAIPFLQTALGSGAGTTFENLLSLAQGGKLTPERVQSIIETVSGLVDGSLEIINKATQGAAGGAIGDMASAIPVLGFIASGVLTAISTVVSAEANQAALEASVEHELGSQLAQKCQEWTADHRPYGTGMAPIQISPGDYFRRLNFAYLEWQENPDGGYPTRWPLDVATMDLLLCGGETQGFGLTRARYNQLLADARKRNPKIGSGIPAAVQRKMWGLIEAMMKTASDPLSPSPIGDQGRALMPVLQDIINRYYFNVSQGSGPGWDYEFAVALSDEIAKRHRWHLNVPVPGGAGVVQRESSCAGGDYGFPRFVNLADGLVDSCVKFQAGLVSNFQTASGKWKIKPTMGFTSDKRSTLLLTDEARLEAALSGADKGKASGGSSAAGLVLVAGLGWLGFKMLRRRR